MYPRPTPYRLIVFAHGWQHTKPRRTRKTSAWGVQCALVRQGYAFMGWHAEQDPIVDASRLPGAGSFCYPGLHAVQRAAAEYLARPDVDQVSVRTNQDRQVWHYFKQADGRVRGYRADQEY